MKLIKSVFIYTQASFPSCHASTIAETPQGLAAAWFGGTDEGQADVGIWLSLHPGPGGDGWSAPFEVADGIEPDGTRYPCWNPVLFQVPGGPLLLFYKVGPSPRAWWGMRKTSSDGGLSWSAAQRLPPGILGPIKNKPLLLPDGQLICPSSSEQDGWKVHFEITPDLGQSWEKTESLNDGWALQAIQPTLLPWSAERIQALCRSGQGRIGECWSADGGRSWSRVQLTTLPNPDSGIDAVLLADGRAVLIYNPTESGRSPLSLALSTDGLTWQRVLDLEAGPGEYSYPAVIQTSDGRVHVLYTWRRQRICQAILEP